MAGGLTQRVAMQFLGGTNLLTGHTDEHWKAVRKAVAPSFSAGNMKWVPPSTMHAAVRHTGLRGRRCELVASL